MTDSRTLIDMQINFNKEINLLALLKSSYKVVSKMIPLSNKIGSILFKPLSYNIMLAKGRVNRLAGYIAKTHMFINYVLEVHKAHGSSFTIKWLKGCHVAICKTLGQNKLLSLRQLTDDLPLPRLLNGLPRVIPFEDRMRIRRGDVSTIRFWLGLFNLYRVLKAPGELKLNSITGNWTGKGLGLLALLRLTKSFNPFLLDAKIAQKAKLVREKMVPTQFVLSRSASPSNSVSMYGILTDVHLLYRSHLLDPVRNYLSLLNASKFTFELEYAKELSDRILELKDEGNFPGVKSGKEIMAPDLQWKTSIVAHGLHPATGGLSQFAIKEEPAGKIRLFALVDNITQSLLRPLHDALFDVLRVIPTDSTFDQDAGVRRASEKSQIWNQAFSFDLSSATDRLPVLLSMYILSNFIGLPLAKLWRIIIVNRTFAFNDKVAEKLKVSNEGVKYRVGQPMGAYTSWAMLAITHHWIVQVAARRCYPLAKPTWFLDYEVLGDDIVIFDSNVAEEYQNILSVLGCDINLNKSIISTARPVFEFAKRTIWGSTNVSGVSLNQVAAGWRVSGRVANALQFASSGLLTSKTLLLAVLSRNAFSGGKVLGRIRTSSVRDQKALSLGVLSLLGERFQKGILSLREVMHAIIEPKGPIDLDKNAIAIPIQAASTLAFSALGGGKPVYPFSHEWDREPKFLEMEDKVATEMLHTSVNKLKQLIDNFDFLVEFGAQQMYSGWVYADPELMFKDIPYNDLPGKHLALLTEIEQFYSMVLGFEMTNLHPQFLYQELFQLMDSMLLYEEAIEIVDKVDSLVQRLEVVRPKAKVQETTIVESAPLLMTLKGVLGSHSRRLWLSDFKTTIGAVHNSQSAKEGKPKGRPIPNRIVTGVSPEL
jgi:hypothetical protein